MSSTIILRDSFAWAGGTGRFGTPGVLETGDPLYVLGMDGLFAFTLGFAFYWSGYAPTPLLSFHSPYYQRYNPAWQAWYDGGRVGPEPPPCTTGDPYQEDMGTLWLDVDGGLRFRVSNKNDNWEAANVFDITSDRSARAIPGAWSVVELKANLQRVSSIGTRLCNAMDAFGGGVGMLAARMNGKEVLRGTPGAFAPVIQTSFCGCFVTKNDRDLGVGFLQPTVQQNSGNKIDDLYVAAWDSEIAGEEPWLGDYREIVIPVAGAGSAAQWTPTGAATNWQAAATKDQASSYNATNDTGKRDLFALQPSADVTSVVVAAAPLIVGRTQYPIGAPAVKGLYRKGGVDHLTPELPLSTAFAAAAGDAGIPVVGETLASLSAGELGYTTET